MNIALIENIKDARLQSPNLGFSGFFNLWQSARELEGVRSPPRHPEERSNLNTSPLQMQFASSFSLIRKARDLYNQGHVLICDDPTLWLELQQIAPSPDHLIIDWIQKLYTHAIKPNLVNALEMLAHPFVKCRDILLIEHTLRKSQQKESTLTEVQGVLKALLLINTQKPFPAYFAEVTALFEEPTQQKLLGFLEIVNLLDDTPDCLEWFRGAGQLCLANPRILLGLHEALKFPANQVVFCLKNPQIKSLQNEGDHEAYQAALHQWAGDAPFTILGLTQDAAFSHPLIRTNIPVEAYTLLKKPKNFKKPTAIPPISSRPTTISASGFDTLMKDPYGFYASYILRLKPLERTAARTPQKEFGILAHKMIEISLKNGFEQATKFIETLEGPQKILWKGRLLRILVWVQSQVAQLGALEIQSEEAFQIQVLDRITLTARIDAAITTPKANLVVNFKTGTPPTKTDVLLGYDPQLAIELFLKMSESHGNSVQAEFWQLKGTTPPGTVSPSIAIPADALGQNIEKILSHYLTKRSVFLACPWPAKPPKYSHYRYLERSG